MLTLPKNLSVILYLFNKSNKNICLVYVKLKSSHFCKRVNLCSFMQL